MVRKKKYEILENDTIEFDGHTLYRIRALKSFRNPATKKCIKNGALGGYIESEKNLSQNGYCWVYAWTQNPNICGIVYENATVEGDAFNEKSIIHGNAIISESSYTRYSEVYGNALIYGNAIIDHCTVYDNAKIYDNAKACCLDGGLKIYGKAEIYNNAIVRGRWSKIFGNTRICGRALVDNGIVYGNISVFDATIKKSRVYGSGVIDKDVRNTVMMQGIDIYDPSDDVGIPKRHVPMEEYWSSIYLADPELVDRIMFDDNQNHSSLKERWDQIYSEMSKDDIFDIILKFSDNELSSNRSKLEKCFKNNRYKKIIKRNKRKED
mgnify:CR=1 FL=1